MNRTLSVAGLTVFALCVIAVFPGVSVVQSGSPTFPLQVDKVTLTIAGRSGKKPDSRTMTLPLSTYEELRGNIDSIFTYADALRNRRRELARCAHASCLTFEYMGIAVMRIAFPCEARNARGVYRSGRLAAAEDRYPFVVVLTRGFSARLKKLTKTGPR
jgi:hypothetical protein